MAPPGEESRVWPRGSHAFTLAQQQHLRLFPETHAREAPGAAQARPCPRWVLQGTRVSLAACLGPSQGPSVGLSWARVRQQQALCQRAPHLGSRPRGWSLLALLCVQLPLGIGFYIQALPGRVPAQACLPRSFRIWTSCSQNCSKGSGHPKTADGCWVARPSPDQTDEGAVARLEPTEPPIP